ncbi:MAG: TetR/AcrR family transcriptional regulator [Egibacteraceae bacterium]
MTENQALAARGDLEADLSPRELVIVRSAYRVIARQGGHRLSLQDIADEAGVSKGLILYHFKNKDNLLLTTMRWALLRTAERIRKGIEGVDDPHAAVQALIDAVWIGPQQNRDFYLLYLDLIEHAARVPSFRGLPTVTREIIEGLYAEIIREGVARRVFDVEDADETAATMRAFIEGTFLQWLQQADWRESYPRYRSRCHEGLLRLLGSSP